MLQQIDPAGVQPRWKGTIMHTGDPHFIRAEFERLLREYWQRQYAASQRDEELQERWRAADEIPDATYQQDRATFPASVQEAYAYYTNTVEAQDWGSAVLYRVL